MLLIYSTGAVTAVGMDSRQTCAAVRAHQSGIEAAIEQAPPAEPLLGGVIPARAALKKTDASWLCHLLLRALKECLKNHVGDPVRLGLFISLPEPFRLHEATRDGTGHAFVANVLRGLAHPVSTHSRVLLSGHSAAATGLELAADLLRRGLIDAAVVGGADSMVGDEDRQRLHRQGRLYEPGQPFGTIPGEGAAFVLVGTAPGPFRESPIAQIVGVGQSNEPDSAATQRYSVGIGLQQAVEAALQQAGRSEGEIKWRITDVNGERYRSWESSMLLTRQYRVWRDRLPCVHVPAFTGDLGAASLALQLIVAARALQAGHAPGALAVCESSSETGLRAACLLAPAPDAPLPPLHSHYSDSRASKSEKQQPTGRDAERIATIKRQVDRLPDELAWLVTHRKCITVDGPGLKTMAELDERIDASLDLLHACGGAGWDAALHALENTGPSGFFAPFVLALELKDAARLQQLFAIVTTEPAAERGLLSAFGWVPAQALQGTIRALLTSADALLQAAGLAACVMHRVDPGAALVGALADLDARLRTRALRVAGEAGRVDLLPQVVAACMADAAAEDETLRFWAARSAVLLGDRSAVLAVLAALAEGSGAWSDAAAEWLLKVLDVGGARLHLRGWSERSKEPGPAGAAARRRLIRRCGVLGDAHFVPWLIGQMADLQVSRLAGEAFTLMAGADLAKLDLERKPPEGASDGQFGGPNEDPADDNVALDEDESLPWPDPERVQGWWQVNQGRFSAGQRFFMGAAPSPAHALKVLREGGQRQRIAAAQWGSLLTPGTKLFQTAAPAWRQQRWLAEMG